MEEEKRPLTISDFGLRIWDDRKQFVSDISRKMKLAHKREELEALSMERAVVGPR